MKRFRVIGVMILWTLAVVLLNHYVGGTVRDRYGDLHRVAVKPWGVISLPVFIIGIVGWYFLNWINIIAEWNRRPVLIFGRYKGTYGPGLVLLEPLLHTFLHDVPVQDVVVTIKLEQAQTNDNVGIAVEGLLTYRIAPDRVRDAVVEVEDVEGSTQERATSTLADEIGKSDLAQLLQHRDTFSQTILTTVGTRVAGWGVTAKAFELKRFKIADTAVEQAIAMKARAQKEGEAELTRAQMQAQIAAALNTAAATYDEKGRWLKGLETILELCRSANNNTVLIPTELAQNLARFFPKAEQI